MKRHGLNISFYFSLVVFGIMTASALILIPFIVIASNRGFFNGMDIIISFILMYMSSLVAGVTLSAIVGNRILNPILRFSEAAKKIADGDFTVRVDENTRIEELSHMARNFNRMAEELGNTQTFRGDFIANLSHEFKTPLATVEGYATLLKSNELSEMEKQEYIEKIIDNTRRLSTMSGNILKISQLEGQAIIKDKKMFRLDEQLRQAILICEAGWSKKNIELDINLSDTIFYGNDELLMQVWLNILVNAIKFTPNGGKISVNLIKSSGSVSVSIKDNGIGMNKDVLNHIFDKFYQGDTSRKSEGNGLGLTLAQRIVKLSGGEINAESTEGSGTEFIVTLPNETSV